MAEMAEFLRVGTTTLVLDVIEAGALPPLPPLRRPIQALHQLCSDTTLTCSVPLSDGRLVTALQLQRFYLEACRRYLANRRDTTDEAYEVLTCWEESLDALDQLQTTGETASTLVGCIDWLTKKHLVDEAGGDATWESRKKIDICYHELSPVGYFQMLQAAGLAPTLVSLPEVERATRTPPANSPATMRGHYIREFSSDADELSVNWKRVVIGSGLSAKSIRLARYGRRRTQRPAATAAGSRDSDGWQKNQNST